MYSACQVASPKVCNLEAVQPECSADLSSMLSFPCLMSMTSAKFCQQCLVITYMNYFTIAASTLIDKIIILIIVKLL